MAMRILILDEEFPWPLNTGKRIRSYSLARELTKYHSVEYMGYARENSGSVSHFREVGIEPHVVPLLDRQVSGPRLYWRLLKNLWSPYPYIVTSHYTERYKQALEKVLAAKEYDLIICEWTPYAIYVQHMPAIKRIAVAHNIESSIWRRYEENEVNSAKRVYMRIQRQKVEAFEQNCFRWFDGAVSVSEPEAATIKQFGVSYPVAVIDNGVDTEYFAPRDTVQPQPCLVFTGSMDWRPNQDAARYFVEEIWPTVKRRCPQMQVFFVGRNPSPDVKALEQQQGVFITGTVDDIRPYIADAAVYIVPLRIGGGSRLKILEAMAMKKAIVSTAVGAEGLKVENGRHLLIADTPEQFAEAVERCLENEPLRRCLGANGRTLVEEQYRWEQLGKRYHEYLTTIVT